MNNGQTPVIPLNTTIEQKSTLPKGVIHQIYVTPGITVMNNGFNTPDLQIQWVRSIPYSNVNMHHIIIKIEDYEGVKLIEGTPAQLSVIRTGGLEWINNNDKLVTVSVTNTDTQDSSGYYQTQNEINIYVQYRYI